jgi:hypothetical protein
VKTAYQVENESQMRKRSQEAGVKDQSRSGEMPWYLKERMRQRSGHGGGKGGKNKGGKGKGGKNKGGKGKGGKRK